MRKNLPHQPQRQACGWSMRAIQCARLSLPILIRWSVFAHQGRRLPASGAVPLDPVTHSGAREGGGSFLHPLPGCRSEGIGNRWCRFAQPPAYRLAALPAQTRTLAWEVHRMERPLQMKTPKAFRLVGPDCDCKTSQPLNPTGPFSPTGLSGPPSPEWEATQAATSLLPTGRSRSRLCSPT